MMTEMNTVLLFGIDAGHLPIFAQTASARSLCVEQWSRDLAPDPNRVALCIVRADRSLDEATPDLEEVRSRFPIAPWVGIGIGQEPSAETVVGFMRSGATDVVSGQRAGDDPIDRCLEWARPALPTALDGLLGNSSAMREIRRQVSAVAETDATVLITGETGTGKGHVAEACHQQSLRRDHPFVHVDCASLSPTLIESELFGHEKGAFTGADSRRQGRFELASRGTVFLDEIGELTMPLQSKLLRVLQDRKFERLGSMKTIPMKARVITATSRDLDEAVMSGNFRRDLYYRINVFRVHMPPLRDRKDDIPAIAQSKLPKLARDLGIRCPAMSDAFLLRLQEGAWRGNVRELLNVLERVLITCRKPVLDHKDLDEVTGRVGMSAPEAEMRMADEQQRVLPSRGARRSDAIRDEIATVLAETGGNIARAARRLSVPRSTLRYWIERHDLANSIPRD